MRDKLALMALVLLGNFMGILSMMSIVYPQTHYVPTVLAGIIGLYVGWKIA